MSLSKVGREAGQLATDETRREALDPSAEDPVHRVNQDTLAAMSDGARDLGPPNCRTHSLPCPLLKDHPMPCRSVSVW